MKTKNIFFAILLLTSAIHFGFKSQANANRPFVFKSLIEIIESNGVQSIDALIPLLPENYKKYFVLMFKSGSLQRATPESPRVISYGSNENIQVYASVPNSDRLLIAFQTDTAQEAPGPHLPNSLEVIEWQAEQKTYQFYEINFPYTKQSVVQNPQTCKACHGTPLRPNWTAYPRWDGALGNSNSLSGDFDVSPFDTRPEDARTLIEKLKVKNERLRALDFGEYFTKNLEYPNAFLSEKIGYQLQKRDTQLIRQLPNFKTFKYALAGAFSECPNPESFFSPETLSALKQNVFYHLPEVPTTSTQVLSADELNFKNLLAMTSELVERNGTHLGHQYVDEVYLATWLRLILEGQGNSELLKNLLGTPPADLKSPNWSYDFVGFTDRMTGMRDNFLKDAASEYPNLYLTAGMVNEQGEPLAGLVDANCGILASQSRKATRNFKTVLPVVRSSPPAAPLNLFQKYCTTCHLTGAHPLPLQDLEGLKIYRTHLNKSIRDRLEAFEMPPKNASAPSASERGLMVKALNSSESLPLHP